jgi:hypothetical protein
MKRLLTTLTILTGAGLGVALGLAPRATPPDEPAPRPAPAVYRPVGFEDSTHPAKPSCPPALRQPDPPAQKAMPSPRMVGPDGTPIERAG